MSLAPASPYLAPLRKDYAIDGGALSAVHFGDSAAPLRLVFLHANGFNALSYRAMLQPLGVHALAVDLRGHGFTRLPADPKALDNWHIFKRDITAFFKRYVDRPVLLAGHSLGAVNAILAAEELGPKCAGYIGFDPVILPQPFRALSATARGRNIIKKRLPIAAKAGRRRADFDSLEAAFSNYKGRAAFKSVPDDILRDYLEGGLRETPNGVRLACDPLWEQAIFCAQNQNTLKAARHLPKLSKIIFAGVHSPTPFSVQARMKSRLGRGAVISSNKLDHLFPLQNPEFAAGIIKEMLSKTPPEAP